VFAVVPLLIVALHGFGSGRWFCHEPNLPGFSHIPSSASAPSGKHSSLSAAGLLSLALPGCYCHCHQTSRGSQKKRQKTSPPLPPLPPYMPIVARQVPVPLRFYGSVPARMPNVGTTTWVLAPVYSMMSRPCAGAIVGPSPPFRPTYTRWLSAPRTRPNIRWLFRNSHQHGLVPPACPRRDTMRFYTM
jgi:hypothetical protein